MEIAKVKPVKYFVDGRGYSMFDILPVAGNGQVNLSKLDKGVVKAFHLHEHQEDYVICISGRAKLALANANFSDVEEIYLSPLDQKIVRIPPGIYHGYMALEEGTVILYYVTTRYDNKHPDEQRARWDSLGKEFWDIDNE